MVLFGSIRGLEQGHFRRPADPCLTSAAASPGPAGGAVGVREARGKSKVLPRPPSPPFHPNLVYHLVFPSADTRVMLFFRETLASSGVPGPALTKSCGLGQARRPAPDAPSSSRS